MQFLPLTQWDIDHAPEWTQEISLRPDRWRDDSTRAVIGRQEDDIVSVGLMWTTRLHGDHYWFEIVVDPRRRRAGVGRATFFALSALRHDEIPFRARGFVQDNQLKFVRALGPRTIQLVPPAQVNTAERRELREHPAVRAGADAPWQDLLDANVASYTWTHARWSPVDSDFSHEVNEGLEHDLDRDATSVAVIDDRIVALALVYRDATPPLLTAETVSAEIPDGERLVEGCVRRSLDVLAGRGVRVVDFDGHISDPHFFPVWSRLSPSGRWFYIVELAPPFGLNLR